MKTNNRKAKGTLSRIIANMNADELARTRNRMLIAAKIADSMQAQGLKQKDFAKMMGKSESEISDWLSGDRNFTIDTLFDIGRALGIEFLNTSMPYVDPIGIVPAPDETLIAATY